MELNLSHQAAGYRRRRKQVSIWKKITMILASVVVFCTTYALILPAITMEQVVICGKEEHLHDETCYTVAPSVAVTQLFCDRDALALHSHDESCLNETGLPVCGYADFVLHRHDAVCYDGDGRLQCPLPEIEAHTHGAGCWQQPHIHSDGCYTSVQGELLCAMMEGEIHAHLETCYTSRQVLICTQPEVEGHTHDDACRTVTATLTCQLTEEEAHAHDDACLDENGALVCVRPVTTGHAHNDACYETTETMTCALPEQEGHTHGDGCYQTVYDLACALSDTEPHVHGSACYLWTPQLTCQERTAEDGAQPILICAQEEIVAHTHQDSCFADGVLTCGLTEVLTHVHSADDCYQIIIQDSQQQVLSCGMEEHSHEESCYPIEDTKNESFVGDGFIDIRYCGIAAHSHGELCYDANGVQLCTMMVHEHDWRCDLLPSDPTAVETPEDWEADLPDLQGNMAADLIAVAESQLGYEQSEINYIIENEEQLFYSRYGAWWDEEDPYGEWNAKFVSFCLHYAGAEDYPSLANCSAWVSELRHRELYELASDYLPNAGDIVFFDRNNDGKADRMGIAESVTDTDVAAIEGDRGGRVAKKTYELYDDSIIAYGALTEAQMPAEEEPVPDDLIGSEDADAWAVLVAPDGQLVEETEPEEAGLLRAGTESWGPYGLRKTVSLFQTRANEPLDLTPYIIAVTMYDEDKNPLPSGSTVTEGDLIEFKIEYTITGQQLAVMNGQNITVKSDTLVYKLPATFKIVQSDSGYILNSSGQQVGTYEIDSETGYITMSFLDSYVEQNASGMQIHGQISFFSTVTKVTDSESENQDHQFTDKITLGVVIQEKIEAVGDLSIEKGKASIDGEEIIYEIAVNSVNGTKGPVVITDQMSKGLTFVTGVGAWDTNGNMIKNAAAFTPSTDRSSFTLELPAMAAGDQYVVRYKCKANVDLLGTDMTVRNTASVTSTNSFDQPLKDITTTTHTFDMLEKKGKANDDGTITWTITVNKAKLDISGWTLEDIMNGQPYTGTVTITNSVGNVVARNVKLPYTFLNGSNDTYTVTYTTSHDLSMEEITNQAILHDHDTEVSVTTGTTVGSPFEKTGEAGEPFQDEDGTWLLPITWTVTVDTRNAAIPGDSWFYDAMFGWPSDDMYMTYDQLMAALKNMEDAVMAITGEDLEWFSAYVYQPGEGNRGGAYGLTDLRGNTDNCQSFKFEGFNARLKGAGIPQGHVVTFSYEAYGVFDNNIVSTTTYKNRFSLLGHYEVEGKVDYIKGAVKATKYAALYCDPDAEVGKYDWELDWSNVEGISHFNYEELHDSYLAWAIELSVPPGYSSTKDIIVYEDLPDGVSVKGLDMPFFEHMPTERLRLQNMVKGETYHWTFIMHSAEQVANWDFANGEEVTITVRLTEEGDLEITIPGKLLKTMSEYIPVYNSWDWTKKVDEWFAYLHIYTQIDEDFEWTEDPSKGTDFYFNAFENRFTIETKDGTLVDKGTQTQVVTKDESEGSIRKEATTDNNNIITYSVLLNAYGRDLVENSNTLAIHDELTYTSTVNQPLRMRLVPGSVKLYEARVKSGGSYEKGAELTANYKYVESPTEAGGTTTWVHTIDLTVPDDKPLLLEYSYMANGNKNATHNVSNTCTISGVAEGNINGDHNLELEVKQSSAQADANGIMIYKVDSQSDGIFLKDAKFNIYIWNKEQNKYIIVNNAKGETAFVTDANGMILLDSSTMDDKQFAYNTAYYIKEVESPNGYYVSPEPYYFYIANDNTVKYPPCIPDGFTGRALTSGDIIYRENTSAYTEISIEKYWRDFGGDSITVTGDKVPSVTVELWQMLENAPGSKTLYGTYTMTPDKDGNWSLTIKDLPKAAKNPDGTRGATYLYYVKEVQVSGYGLESSENNNGINSGTIKLVNREQNGYELPETGGGGAMAYRLMGSGILLTLPILYVAKRRYRGRRVNGG